MVAQAITFPWESRAIMDDTIRRSLDHSQVVDITTIGRKSGQPRRIEIYVHSSAGRLYISGMPRRDKRAWLLNLEANPVLTLHLKDGIRVDLPGTARVITDEAERRQVMALVARAWRRTDVDQMVEWSPLIEVSVPGYGQAVAA